MLKKIEKLVAEYVYDFSKDAGAIGTIVLKATDPNGALLDEGFIVQDVMIYVEKAVTSAGTPTITFGNSSDVDGYLVDTFALVGSANAVVRAGQVDGALIWNTTLDAKLGYRIGSAANTKDVVMAIGTAALTGGKIRVVVEGVFPSSAPEIR
jgi:hypothetical protein